MNTRLPTQTAPALLASPTGDGFFDAPWFRRRAFHPVDARQFLLLPAGWHAVCRALVPADRCFDAQRAGGIRAEGGSWGTSGAVTGHRPPAHGGASRQYSASFPAGSAGRLVTEAANLLVGPCRPTDPCCRMCSCKLELNGRRRRNHARTASDGSSLPGSCDSAAAPCPQPSPHGRAAGSRRPALAVAQSARHRPVPSALLVR